DDQIGLEAGFRLQQRIALRVLGTISLDELLLAEPLEPHPLPEAFRSGAAGPFPQAGLHPPAAPGGFWSHALAGPLCNRCRSQAEAGVIMRFASALGCTLDQVRALCRRAAPWIETAV